MSIGLATKGMICHGGGGGGNGTGATVFVPFGGFAIRLGEIAPGLNINVAQPTSMYIEIKEPIKEFKQRVRIQNTNFSIKLVPNKTFKIKMKT